MRDRLSPLAPPTALFTAALFTAVLATLLLCGCSFDDRPSGPPRHLTKALDLDKAELVRVTLKMGAGELSVSGGSPRLLDADFDYTQPSGEPSVQYHSTGVRGDLTIEQPPFSGPHGGDYKWNLRLNNRVPLDFVTRLGAGEARLNLGDLILRSVEINMGVGELTLDLRDPQTSPQHAPQTTAPERDMDVSIHGGVGQATIYLPASAAISAVTRGGIGSISVEGLEKRNGRWINPAHEHAARTIHLDVQGGVGEIRLVTG